MNNIALSIAALALVGFSGSSIGGEKEEAGKTVYAAKGCAACHGPAGVATLPQYPNLAGQNAPYAVLALKAYKEGQRNSANAAVMKPMSMLLTDDEIENVAAYLASLK